MFRVTAETIYNWENNRNEPPVSGSAKIIEFLGYNPFQIHTSTLAGKLKAYRYANGFSQEQAANALALDETTIIRIEGGKFKFSGRTLNKLRPMMDKTESPH